MKPLLISGADVLPFSPSVTNWYNIDIKYLSNVYLYYYA